MARELGAVDRYAALLHELLERSSTPAQSYARCEVLLRLGELAEGDDPERAFELYRAAEATGVREVDVWRALASCAAARGDTALQLELLTRLSTLGEQQSGGAETRADALYRLAEVQLAHADGMSDGIVSLARAFEEDPRNERAGRIIERACRDAEPNPDLLALYERVARSSQDPALLLGFLERQARRADALPEEIREAVELALQQDRAELAEDLMLHAVQDRCGASRRQRPRAMGADRARRPALRTARPGGRGQVVARGGRKREPRSDLHRAPRDWRSWR